MAKQTAEIVPGEVTQAQWDAKYGTTTESLKDMGGADSKDADDLPESLTKKWAGASGADFIKSADDLDDITEGTAKKHFLAAEKTKLTAIEEEATADQTGIEMVGSLEALDPGDKLDADAIIDGVTNKAYSGTEQTKLSGVEEGAKDDQTGAEVRDLVVALSDTERQLVITDPAVGEFKVTGVHRNAAGNLEYDYDDVPEE